jgi:23S rRNA-/tRNA-specific pseudouridylate synthase
MPAPVPQNLDLGHAPGTGLHVLHEDAHILVLDKPSGLLSVPAKPPGPQDCLHARAVAAFPDALLIHRLDMETSGVTVFARSRSPSATSTGSSSGGRCARPTSPASRAASRATSAASTCR